MTTVLDPAHGGTVTCGKSTPDGRIQSDGRAEKAATLALAHDLGQTLGDLVRFTREADINPSLADRIATARQAQARVFLSLHIHPPGNRRRSGSTAWVHTAANEASTQLAAEVQRALSGASLGSLTIDVPRGDLAVLAPELHDPATAACLVDLEVAQPDDQRRHVEALGRALSAHQARYGRGPVAVGLDNSEIALGSTEEILRYISDRMGRLQSWQVGLDCTRLFPFSAICQIAHKDAAGNVVNGGTGFYIAANRLLTAGHVLVNSAAGFTFDHLEITPGKNGGVCPFGSFTVRASACHPHPNWFDTATNTGGFDSDFDMGIIEVTTPPPHGRYFDELDDRAMSIAPVAICGYGMTQTNVNNWYNLERQHLDLDNIRTVSDNMEQVSYDAFTEGGTSGSPVFYTRAVEDDVRQQSYIEIQVVGVHSSGFTADQNRSESQLNTCVRLSAQKMTWIAGFGVPIWGRRGKAQPKRPAAAPRALAHQRPPAAPVRRIPAQPRGSHERYGKPIAKAQYGIIAPPGYNPGSQAESIESLCLWQAELNAFLAGVPPEAHGWYPHLPICKLIIDGGGQGTGFWIGNNKILTAGHCISGASSILVAPGRARTSTRWEVEVDSANFRLYPGYASVTDTDLGIIKLPPGHLMDEIDPFQLEQLNQCPMGGLIICGYASRITHHDATNTGINGMSVDPDIQHLSSGRFDPNGNTLFDLYSNLTQGTSGGPVFYIDGNGWAKAVGIAVGARHDGQFNIGVALDQTRIDWINAQ